MCGYTHATDNAINLLGVLNEALMAARYAYIIMGTHTMDDTTTPFGVLNEALMAARYVYNVYGMSYVRE